eukprot:SAG11_NODE_9892_length_872_cov_0.576973_1_plen_29_part_01
MPGTSVGRQLDSETAREEQTAHDTLLGFE